MTAAHVAEIESNFQFFLSVVDRLVSNHRNQYALIRERQVEGIFTKVGDAVTAANARFDDGRYSIQRITDRGVDLGFLSNGSNLGISA